MVTAPASVRKRQPAVGSRSRHRAGAGSACRTTHPRGSHFRRSHLSFFSVPVIDETICAPDQVRAGQRPATSRRGITGGRADPPRRWREGSVTRQVAFAQGEEGPYERSLAPAVILMYPDHYTRREPCVSIGVGCVGHAPAPEARAIATLSHPWMSHRYVRRSA